MSLVVRFPGLKTTTKALLDGGLPKLNSTSLNGKLPRLHSYAYSRWDDDSGSLDVWFPGLKPMGKASLDGVRLSMCSMAMHIFGSAGRRAS